MRLYKLIGVKEKNYDALLQPFLGLKGAAFVDFISLYVIIEFTTSLHIITHSSPVHSSEEGKRCESNHLFIYFCANRKNQSFHVYISSVDSQASCTDAQA